LLAVIASPGGRSPDALGDTPTPECAPLTVESSLGRNDDFAIEKDSNDECDEDI
jgi:hypothetical protein